MLSKLAGLIVGREPVAFAAVVSGLIGLAVAYGAHLSAEQQAAIGAAVTALFGFAARAVVTPPDHLPKGPQ